MALILAASLPLPVNAQEESTSQSEILTHLEKLQAEIQRLQVEIEKLKQQQELMAKEPAQQAKVSATPTEAAQEAVPAKKRSTPAWLNRFSFRGKSYLRYSWELQPGQRNFNEFDLDRFYFTAYMRVNDRVRMRYTVEGARRDSNGDFDVATKYFYLEASDLLYKSSRLFLGQAGLPWVPHEEHLWGYRFQGTVFPDREGYLTSTDLGIGWKASFPKGYGDYHFAVVNGEGWHANEVGKHKDFHLRVTLKPFAHHQWGKAFFLTGFRSVGSYDGVAAGLPNDRKRTLAQLGFHRPYWTIAGEYLWAADLADSMQKRHPSLAARAGQIAHGRGYSLFGVLNFGLFSEAAESWEVIARFDRLDPDIEIGNNEHFRWIAGLSYRWNKYLQTLIDFERVQFDPGSLRTNERRLMVQSEIKF
ncbi:MAG: hypothetical protein ACE5MH_07520 [Terriglobia bacterium]